MPPATVARFNPMYLKPAPAPAPAPRPIATVARFNPMYLKPITKGGRKRRGSKRAKIVRALKKVLGVGGRSRKGRRGCRQ